MLRGEGATVSLFSQAEGLTPDSAMGSTLRRPESDLSRATSAKSVVQKEVAAPDGAATSQGGNDSVGQLGRQPSCNRTDGCP